MSGYSSIEHFISSYLIISNSISECYPIDNSIKIAHMVVKILYSVLSKNISINCMILVDYKSDIQCHIKSIAFLELFTVWLTSVS